MRRGIISVLVAFLVLLQASAALAEPSLVTDMWVYNDGDTVTVSGAGFAPSEVVDLVTTDPDGVQVDSGEAGADADGSFTYQFVLHATQSGIYNIVGTGRTSGLSATAQFDPPPPWTPELRFTDRRFTASADVLLTWNLAGSSSDCYYLYRSTSAMSAIAAAAGPVNCSTTVPSGNLIAVISNIATVSYADTTALTTSDYYYFARAVKNGNGGGITVSSNQVTTKSLLPLPTSHSFPAAGAQTFTITNTGLGAMTFRSVTVTGANASDFVVSAAPAAATSIPNTAGTNFFTFVVTYSPSGAGTRTATLSVNASEPAHVLSTTFDTRLINLTGVGT